MPRVRVEMPIGVSIPEPTEVDSEQGETLDDAMAKMPNKKRRSSAGSPSQIDRAFKEFDELFKGNRWRSEPNAIKPEHAVAFYARLHTKVYSTKGTEVFPEELRNRETWLGACSAAKSMFQGSKKEFDDGTKLFEFVLWTWQKENDKVKWLRDNDKPIGRRISWRDQFVLRYKLTDYRQAMAEEKERGKRR
jgi:hypothetical protein